MRRPEYWDKAIGLTPLLYPLFLGTGEAYKPMLQHLFRNKVSLVLLCCFAILLICGYFISNEWLPFYVNCVAIVISVIAICVTWYSSQYQKLVENKRIELEWIRKDISARLAEMNFNEILSKILADLKNINKEEEKSRQFILFNKYQSAINSAAILYNTDKSSDRMKAFYNAYEKQMGVCRDCAQNTLFALCLDNTEKLIDGITICSGKEYIDSLENLKHIAIELVNEKEREFEQICW